jgi:hypothetical protein
MDYGAPGTRRISVIAIFLSCIRNPRNWAYPRADPVTGRSLYLPRRGADRFVEIIMGKQK